MVVGFPVLADQRDERLPGLFDRLKASSSASEAKALEAVIWQIWSDGGDGETNTLMRRGVAAMAEDDQIQALAVFNEMVRRRPDFAEGWNKRATVYFLVGDFTSSVSDIEKTLELEPRHFGALTGTGLVLEREGFDDRAREVFLKVRTIYPLAPDIQKPLDKPVPDEGSNDI